jgi:hypothetical protein
MESLTRKQALFILPAVVDNEASEDEKRAFFEYIKEHPDIRSEFENARKIKFIMSARCPKKPAPEQLKNKILHQIDELDKNPDVRAENEQNLEQLQQELQQREKPSFIFLKYAGTSFRYIAAGAVILLISLVILELLDQTGPGEPPMVEFIVENMSAQYFLAAGGGIIDPHFATNSISEAEQFLFDQYGMELTIPEISGAEFAGIVMADFLENFQTPLFEYNQTDLGETIYIFVFNVDSLKNHKNLKRHEKAVKSCVRSSDFYVAEIDDHHVVSWLWNNSWYTAISNHNGYDLASLIETLDHAHE